MPTPGKLMNVHIAQAMPPVPPLDVDRGKRSPHNEQLSADAGFTVVQVVHSIFLGLDVRVHRVLKTFQLKLLNKVI